MYPTRASNNPLFANALRYMCSTPQKHPAAIVAVSELGGKVIGAAGELIVTDENGRNRRLRKDIKIRSRARNSRFWDFVVKSSLGEFSGDKEFNSGS